eukprot:TRINITY_DN11689_c0_g1_i1.p1 TRINITY_DN11689_c0_g1~~TRINITY_DN11689_c0_g1_i1.p1  ORF type:complete len:137 (-),score=21.54 TRINITY_DN11689_c0_g1_i1:573-935(-)
MCIRDRSLSDRPVSIKEAEAFGRFVTDVNAMLQTRALIVVKAPVLASPSSQGTLFCLDDAELQSFFEKGPESSQCSLESLIIEGHRTEMTVTEAAKLFQRFPGFSSILPAPKSYEVYTSQ